MARIRTYTERTADLRELVITSEMVKAGVERLCELLEAGVGSAYVVSDVYQAMDSVRSLDSK